jgi:hypothetical protein
VQPDTSSAGSVNSNLLLNRLQSGVVHAALTPDRSTYGIIQIMINVGGGVDDS